MLIKVKVKPGSNREELIKKPDFYIAYIKARPINGKANESLIKLIAKEFNLLSMNIKIKNPISRIKLIEIKKEQI